MSGNVGTLVIPQPHSTDFPPFKASPPTVKTGTMLFSTLIVLELVESVNAAACAACTTQCPAPDLVGFARSVGSSGKHREPRSMHNLITACRSIVRVHNIKFVLVADKHREFLQSDARTGKCDLGSLIQKQWPSVDAQMRDRLR